PVVLTSKCPPQRAKEPSTLNEGPCRAGSEARLPIPEGVGIATQVEPSLVDFQNRTVPPPESQRVQVAARSWLWKGSQSIVQAQMAKPIVEFPQLTALLVPKPRPLLICVQVTPWLVLM